MDKECILKSARFCQSPNCSERPDGVEPSLLVIHNISLPPKEYGGPYIEQLFTNCLDCHEHKFFEEIIHLRVSSHFLIRRNGELVQYVPMDKKAWHAGESSFQGRTDCNDFSIGIELEGCDEEPFEQVQYEELKSLTLVIMKMYPEITKERIVGHSDIAPQRKTDPGPYFDWGRYLACL